MEKVMLPAVDGGVKLSEALDLLKKRRSSAFVTRLKTGAAVIDVDILLHALRKRGDRTVDSLRPRFRALELTEGESASKRLRGSARGGTQELMDAKRAAFVVTRLGRGKAEVLTRHESYLSLLGGAPDLWRCTSNARHVWLSSDLVQPGNRCRIDGSGTVAV